MKILLALLFMTSSVFSQTVPSPVMNNATVNLTGNFNNVIINQSGTGYHTATINSTGDNIPINITQSGNTNKSISIDIHCTSNCAANPYIINQY
jgi:Cu/Zn superoxide dismutase